MSKALQKQRAWAEQKLAAGEKFGIAIEYPTFDLLWFDIEWRVRSIMEGILIPVRDTMTESQDFINQLFQENTKANQRVDELKEVVFNTNGKLDIFEQINLKIATVDAERKILKD